MACTLALSVIISLILGLLLLYEKRKCEEKKPVKVIYHAEEGVHIYEQEEKGGEGHPGQSQRMHTEEGMCGSAVQDEQVSSGSENIYADMDQE